VQVRYAVGAAAEAVDARDDPSKLMPAFNTDRGEGTLPIELRVGT
jgi:hypothetical protein